jgi:predicted RNA-binding protein with RPS1 domain
LRRRDRSPDAEDYRGLALASRPARVLRPSGRLKCFSIFFTVGAFANFADVNLVGRLSQTATALGSTASVGFARDFSFRQLKSGNMILLGTRQSNPWIQSFDSYLALRWKFDPALDGYYPVDIKASPSDPSEADKFRPGADTLKTILYILERAGAYRPTLYLKIENPPYMALVIEATPEPGPLGLPAISVAHYGEQNGDLMRISELSNRFIKDPSEAVKAGQIVKVKVLSADLKAKRIALSMKALMGPARNNQRPKQPGHQPPSQPSLNEKLAMLSSKWRVS